MYKLYNHNPLSFLTSYKGLRNCIRVQNQFQRNISIFEKCKQTTFNNCAKHLFVITTLIYENFNYFTM